MAKKAKGSSFSNSSTRAGTAAYNTKNKVRIAKEALEKKKSEIKDTKAKISADYENYKDTVKVNRPVANVYAKRIKSNLKELSNQKTQKGKISQAVSDRSRSASRAAGIAKRVAKKKK